MQIAVAFYGWIILNQSKLYIRLIFLFWILGIIYTLAFDFTAVQLFVSISFCMNLLLIYQFISKEEWIDKKPYTLWTLIAALSGFMIYYDNSLVNTTADLTYFIALVGFIVSWLIFENYMKDNTPISLCVIVFIGIGIVYIFSLLV